MVIVVNVLCDSLGILICFPNGSRKSAWGRVKANSSITKPRLSSSCCKFNLIYYLFIYLFSTCKVLKLPGFSGVILPSGQIIFAILHISHQRVKIFCQFHHWFCVKECSISIQSYLCSFINIQSPGKKWGQKWRSIFHVNVT